MITKNDVIDVVLYIEKYYFIIIITEIDEIKNGF